jgi:hypothetical protein
VSRVINFADAFRDFADASGADVRVSQFSASQESKRIANLKQLAIFG